MTKRVPIPFVLGRKDKGDPKHAPFGVLKEGKNLRVRKDGRLGVRNGYQPLVMTTKNGTLSTKDLIEFRGRLLALGSDDGDGYPTDTFEYLGLPARQWRGTDTLGQRVTVNPFTNLREVAGIPQPEGGITQLDVASGGGYVCMAYRTFDSTRLYLMVVDAATDQTRHIEQITLTGPAAPRVDLKLAWSSGVFYCSFVSSTGAITLRQFDPLTSTGNFASFATVAAAGAVVSAHDLVPVTHGSTARVAVVYSRGVGTNVVVQVFDSAGALVGSAITIAGTDTVFASLEADQVHGTINLFTIEAAAAGKLRTFSFAGALLVGPTATTGGTSGSVVRMPALGASPELVVISSTDGVDLRLNYWIIATHVAAHAVTALDRVVPRSRLVSGQSANQPLAVVFSALVAPTLPSFDQATNALFFVTPTVAHMTARDFVRGLDVNVGNLTLDASTGKLAWACLRDPGVDSQGVPIVTLVDFQSAARRQTAVYGALLYSSGGTPSVYDGRLGGEIGFSEAPGVVTLAPAALDGGLPGSMTALATYYYTVHWEVVLADGSLMVSVPSAGGKAGESVQQMAAVVTLGALDTLVRVTVTTPHCLRLALGDDLFGADVVAVVSRTEWDPVSGTARSELRRSKVAAMRIGMGHYGATQALVDTRADSSLAVQEVLYTQGERGSESGPLEQNSPQPCSFIVADASRLILGGLSRPEQFQVSRDAFLGEAFSFSEFDAFFGQVAGPVTGVQSLDTTKIVFTTDAVYSVFGEGPDDLGGGSLSPPQEVPTPSGLQDWRSFLKVPEGVFFQLDDTKLFILPRGAASPVWAAADIEDLLLAYPVITGACKHKGDNAGVFACVDLAGSDARLAVFDFRTTLWLTDTPVLGGGAGVDAVVSFRERIAYCSGGAVYAQTTGFVDGAATFISTQIVTRPLYPFGLGGAGEIYEALLTGEYRGECDITARVSYDDGKSFTTLTPFTLTPAAVTGLAVGQTIQRKWSLPQDITSSVVFEFTTADTGSGASEGFVFNQIDLLVEPEDGLRELDPLECA
jgi:hypothetical protein